MKNSLYFTTFSKFFIFFSIFLIVNIKIFEECFKNKYRIILITKLIKKNSWANLFPVKNYLSLIKYISVYRVVQPQTKKHWHLYKKSASHEGGMKETTRRNVWGDVGLVSNYASGIVTPPLFLLHGLHSFYINANAFLF